MIQTTEGVLTGTLTQTQGSELTPEIVPSSLSLSALNITGATYQPVRIGCLWPPAVPKDARFLPIENFSSLQQILLMKRAFEIVIDQAAYNKMMCYTMQAPGEVSGFGKVVRTGNSFLVQDVVALEQVNTAASSRIFEETLNQFMRQMRKHGLDTEGYDLFWHSHHTMPVFFSTTDMDTVEALHNSRFTMSIVVNQRLESRCRVDFYDPVRYGIDNLPLKVAPVFNPGQAEAYREEMGRIMKFKPLKTVRRR
jgi:hypothetical protein